MIGPCAAVSLVGRNIRAILHRLGEALELFEEQKIYLVTQAANDLNITFVIDEEHGDRLVARLHEIAIRKMTADRVLGPTWEELYGGADQGAVATQQWWQDRRDELLALGREHGAAFVYDRATLKTRAQSLKALPGIDAVFYAMKANWHPQILQVFYEQGLGFECVSRGEVEHVVATLPGHRSQAHPLHAELRAARGVRMGGGAGRSGSRSTTCIRSGNGRSCSRAASCSCASIPATVAAITTRCARRACIRSSVCRCSRSRSWSVSSRRPARRSSGCMRIPAAACSPSTIGKSVGDTLTALTQRFRDVRTVDLGGGLGVPERLGQQGVMLPEFGATLAALKAAHPKLALWIEPGRYLVAEAGVLLAQVTQLKGKGEVHYVGVATGMNSLIRPALYGAHHEILNLSRLDDLATEVVERGRADLRVRRPARRRSPAAADRGRRHPVDRHCRRLRPFDELALQPARPGARVCDLRVVI